MADVIATHFVQIAVGIAVVTALPRWFVEHEARFAYAFINASNGIDLVPLIAPVVEDASSSALPRPESAPGNATSSRFLSVDRIEHQHRETAS